MVKQEDILWNKIFVLIGLHVIALIGVYNFIYHAQYKTIAWFTIINVMSAIGVGSGAHRLWSHNSYKACTTLKVILMVWHTMALQESVFKWCRDHRLHHKYSDTNGDPYNASRGFFYSHMGWLMVKKHPDIKEKGKSIYLDDLVNDPVVAFNKKYYWQMAFWIFGVIPTVIPYLLWQESLWVSYTINITRYVEFLHRIWSVNSAAHTFGKKLYNAAIYPSENMLVAYLSIGEGYHNFHHVYPYDYSNSEFGWTTNFNLNTAFIDLAHYLNLAWDKKKVIEKREDISMEKLKDLGQHGSVYYQYFIGISQIAWMFYVRVISDLLFV